jgi:exosortase
MLSAGIFWSPLWALFRLAAHDDRYSQILVIPVVVGSFVFLSRERIFKDCRYCLSLGIPLFLVSLALYYWTVAGGSDLIIPGTKFSLVISTIIFTWALGFLMFYGKSTVRAGIFPLSLAVFLVPWPPFLLDRLVIALQHGSAATSYALFKLVHVPILRHDLQFSLPRIDIEIAAQCSGIRSSMSLFLAGLLSGHIFLQSNWKRFCLALCMMPVVIFKNALRIVTIALLGSYVDLEFLHGNLHRYGGLIFSLVSLAFLIALILLLERTERGKRENVSLESLGTIRNG